MIDLHSHMLPNVDDGSDSLSASIELVKEAIKLGIHDIVLTPHYEVTPVRMIPGVNIKEQFLKFCEEIKKQNLEVNLYLGNEVTHEENLLNDIKDKKILTINNSRYILLELDFYSLDLEIGEYIYELSLLGYQVIIAHVERYIYTNYSYVEMLVNEGALIQVNANALISKDSNMKKMIFRFL